MRVDGEWVRAARPQTFAARSLPGRIGWRRHRRDVACRFQAAEIESGHVAMRDRHEEKIAGGGAGARAGIAAVAVTVIGPAAPVAAATATAASTATATAAPTAAAATAAATASTA